MDSEQPEPTSNRQDHVDPFAARRSGFSSFTHALLATALFRCWHILLFFTTWATAIYLIDLKVHNLVVQPTMLTVLGTVLGFVVSYRTTSSFERYNEGRRLWAQIVLGTRTFARMVWFHVPDVLEGNRSAEEVRARVLVEKKTVINLLEAFGVAVKHYLRGEDGIHYVDLYHLVKHLPAYALPAGIPSQANLGDADEDVLSPLREKEEHGHDLARVTSRTSSNHSLPLPSTARGAGRPRKQSVVSNRSQHAALRSPVSGRFPSSPSAGPLDDGLLMPARMPPKYGLFDLFPFSLLVRSLEKRGKELAGKKAARLRAKRRGKESSHNIPLEVSLYLSSYIAALQQRKCLDPPTNTALMTTLTQLVDALTGLERILTTPIPFSYSVHLWVVTTIYCLVLPFQLVGPLQWVVIPGTAIVSFFFFGFLVAGEEIENPFGYDKNDLNMDHFTHNIIRNELRAITAMPAPHISTWAFAPANDAVFGADASERLVPEEWVRRGASSMQAALAGY